MEDLKHWQGLASYFIPHPHTHAKAKLLRWHFLISYLLLFMLLQVGFDLLRLHRPGVLGIESKITVGEVIGNTNKERQKLGLGTLTENTELDKAALDKAKNMFVENYWAHYSPSGKDPWGFILGAGYRFSYAGENLARNFYTSQEVVDAWMNSPSHRDNLLNSHYQDVGIAVLEGTLQGQRTTLVVQEFGSPYQSLAAIPDTKPDIKPEVMVNKSKLFSSEIAAPLSPDLLGKAVIDPFFVNKAFSVGIVTLLFGLLIIDFYILKRRGVNRSSSHHFANLGFLVMFLVIILVSKVGGIL